MLKTKMLLAGAIAAVVGAGASQPAMAVTQNRLVSQTGANMCTLTKPTVDTAVRARATGFRNEGTTSAFVICSFNSPPGDQAGTSGIQNALIYLYSMDGANHPAVSCTGVNSLTDGTGLGVPAPQFVVVTHDVNTTGTFGAFGVQYIWNPADFGGTTTIPTFGGAFSVTCILPPQVGIKIGFSNSTEDVGS